MDSSLDRAASTLRQMRESAIGDVRAIMRQDNACDLIGPSDLRLLIGAIDDLKASNASLLSQRDALVEALEKANKELRAVREWADVERAPLRAQEIASISRVIDMATAALAKAKTGEREAIND